VISSDVGVTTGKASETADVLLVRKGKVACVQELKWVTSIVKNIGCGYICFYHG